MVEARVYVCEECRKRALKGEGIRVFLDGPREFYLDRSDVYKCEHIMLLAKADKLQKVGAEFK